MTAVMIDDGYINPDDLYRNELTHWEELWDEGLSLYKNVKNILASSVFLPQKDIMLPLVAIYILMPSKWARVVPVLFNYGDKGSGKSTIAILAAKLHNTTVLSSTSTFASIRNILDKAKWLDPIKTQERDGVLLCWDNLKLETFVRDPKVYELLLVGYNRSTDSIQIAAPDGTNKDYKVFCPKIISSIDPIHLDYDYLELRRRLLVIPHKPWERFTPEEQAAHGGENILLHKLDIDSIYWEGIEEKFFEFWNDRENCKTYVAYRGMLTRKHKRFEISDSFNAERWTISIDLLATGLTLGAWSDVKEAIAAVADYWEYANKQIFGEYSATLEHLKVFINSEVGVLLETNERLAAGGLMPAEVIINPSKLKEKLAYLQSLGALDITPNYKDVRKIMNDIGWKLTAKGWVQK